MNSHFVADGAVRWHSSAEVESRLATLRDEVDARYANQIEEAVFLRRIVLRWHRWCDYQRERRLIVPSPESLY